MFKILSKKEYKNLIDELKFQTELRKASEKLLSNIVAEKKQKEKDYVIGGYCNICKNHFDYTENWLAKDGSSKEIHGIGCKLNIECKNFKDCEKR